LRASALGQKRTLPKVSFAARAAIWLNLPELPIIGWSDLKFPGLASLKWHPIETRDGNTRTVRDTQGQRPREQPVGCPAQLRCPERELDAKVSSRSAAKALTRRYRGAANAPSMAPASGLASSDPNLLRSKLLENALVMPVAKGPGGELRSGVFDSGELITSSLLMRSYSKAPIIGAAIPRSSETTLAGEYVFGGYVFPHYGHFLLETCSRLWFAKQRPDLSIVWAWGESLPAFAPEIFRIIGLTNSHVFLPRPTLIERLHVPDPAYRIWKFCAREMIELLGVYQASRMPGRRVWLSRSALPSWQAKIFTEPRIEQRLQKAGWEIFHPERHRIEEQLETLGSAEEIAGFEGSAFHSLLLLRSCPRVTIFGRGDEINGNYALIGKAKGLSQTIKPLHTTYAFGRYAASSYSLSNSGKILDGLNVAREPMATFRPAAHTVRRISALLEHTADATYLEIGVASGESFFSVPAARKIAVDPQFRFDFREVESSTQSFFEMTSDEYFQYHSSNEALDFVFIDGMHTFAQSYRDFCNALQLLAPGGAILLDDTVPSDPHSMIPNQKLAVKARKQAGGQGGQWHGDVFKVVFMIHDFHPLLSYATISSDGNPQTLVWREPRRNFTPKFNSLEEISRLTWEDLQANRHILKLTPEADVLAAQRVLRKRMLRDGTPAGVPLVSR
jgi:hypothetical protein